MRIEKKIDITDEFKKANRGKQRIEMQGEWLKKDEFMSLCEYFIRHPKEFKSLKEKGYFETRINMPKGFKACIYSLK